MLSSRRFRWFGCLLTVITLVGCQTTKRVTPPPTTSYAQFDEDTPLGAMKALEAALAAGDEAKIVSMMRAATPLQQKFVRERAKGQAKIAVFKKELDTRFGPKRGPELQFLGTFGLLFPLGWIDLNGATVRDWGDTAVIDDARHSHLQIMILEGGRWKAFFYTDELHDKTQMEMLISVCEPMAKAIDQTTDEMKAGKYATAQEVAGALSERISAIGDKWRGSHKEPGGG